jgi:hypothetical protein
MNTFTAECEWLNWVDWTTCSKSCGGGQQSRKRTEIATSSNSEVPCVGTATQGQSCNTNACPGL